ncbi:MAG TPA: hypothetical protein VG714_05965 [Acidobacteriaceae bacterium]|nr:hypothetical protein [Acidobacteriaceae bacterium]
MKQWHQQGEALLTFENARSFLNAAGLVLFSPRPQIAAPAPSFVEAALGGHNPSPSLAEQVQARELLARLVAEGLAVPLNLLGVGSVLGPAGDTPDFIVSSQVFSYIFTLRGDKGWKQPPQPNGPVRFSNLAIAAHEVLGRRGALTSSDLARELGKEVTETAVLRALGELWTHLRALPLPQLDGQPTLWELSTARFLRQVKAGANAGLPTALSTLIALYLGQAILASEEEVESFLSPLAARSRIRDVVHALIAARELETLAIEGRTSLYIADGLPASLTEPVASEVSQSVLPPGAEKMDKPAAEPSKSSAEEVDSENPVAGGPARIRKFAPVRRPGGNQLAKARPAKGVGRPQRSAPFSDRPKFRPRPQGDSSDRPRFKPRAPRDFRPRENDREGARPAFKRPFIKRDRSDSQNTDRRTFQRKESGPRSGRPTDGAPGFNRGRKSFGSAGDAAPRRFDKRSPQRHNDSARPKSGERRFGGAAGSSKSGKPFESRERKPKFGGKNKPFEKRPPARKPRTPRSEPEE